MANLGAADTTARCRAPDANYLPRFDPSVASRRALSDSSSLLRVSRSRMRATPAKLTRH